MISYIVTITLPNRYTALCTVLLNNGNGLRKQTSVVYATLMEISLQLCSPVCSTELQSVWFFIDFPKLFALSSPTFSRHLFCCVVPFHIYSPNMMGSSEHDILPPAERMKEDEVEPALFFDSFPKEILETVLRYFSNLPSAKK